MSFRGSLKPGQSSFNSEKAAEKETDFAKMYYGAKKFGIIGPNCVFYQVKFALWNVACGLILFLLL